jgi:branched-chain amino acid transport system substrate-binding protein
VEGGKSFHQECPDLSSFSQPCLKERTFFPFGVRRMPMPNLTGQSIGRYRIIEQLGEGGMATVYKAYDSRLERDVAIKVIRIDQFAPAVLERVLKRFEREAKALARLTHTNIVHVNDYGEHEGIPYLVMDYLPGGTLKQRLGKPMSWQQAVHLLLPIAEALDYAHDQNIIHRDVKPSNILLTQRGQPMLTDFGIAKILEGEDTTGLTGTGMGLGTPEYMAPEQWTGQAGPLSDLYSLGVVLYELVTGRKPYTADTPAAIMLKQANDPLPRPRQFAPDLPEAMEKVLFKALAKQPEDRYQSMGEFTAALDKVLTAGRTIEATEFLQEAGRKEEEATLLSEDIGGREAGLAGKEPIVAEAARKRKFPWAWGMLGLIPILALAGWLVWGHTGQPSQGNAPTQGLVSATPPGQSVNSQVPVILPTATQAPVILPPVTQIPATQMPILPAEAICKNDKLGCKVFLPGQTIQIGMGAPMTGDNASFGVDISQAARLAITDAGQFKGFPFELVTADDGGTEEGGAMVANQFFANPQIVAIEGHIFSGATKAAIPIYEAASLPMMSPSATNPALTQSGSRVFNRCTWTDVSQGQFAAAYLYTKLNVRNLAIMHDGQAYGQGLAQVVRDQFTALGGRVVAFQAIPPGKVDYSAVLADIAISKPQALFFGGYSPEAVVIVNQMKPAGLAGVPFFSDDGTYGQDFLDRTGINGEGAYSASMIPPPSAARGKFDAAYLTAYGKPAGSLSPYTWTGYDAAAVLIQAIEKVAVLDPDGKLYIPRDALVAAVRSTRDYQGLSGIISCDLTGECAASGPVFYVDRSGKWVEAPK